MARLKKQKQGANLPAVESLPARVTVSDVLQHGTPAEMRESIGLIAAMLESKSEHLDIYRPWLVDALRQIAQGGDANKAFGLDRRNRRSPHEVSNIVALAENLMQQGMTKMDAYDFIARVDRERGILRPVNKKGGHEGEALKKNIEAAHKHIFGSITRTK